MNILVGTAPGEGAPAQAAPALRELDPHRTVQTSPTPVPDVKLPAQALSLDLRLPDETEPTTDRVARNATPAGVDDKPPPGMIHGQVTATRASLLPTRNSRNIIR